MHPDFTEQIAQKTDTELIEICAKSSDYQPAFVELASREAARRNIPVEVIEHYKEKIELVEERNFAAGTQGSQVYLALLTLSAIGGGIPAIVGGYIYAYSTHYDSKGEKYFVYNEETRKWGRINFFLGIGILSLIVFGIFS